ncbi:MAG: hypothetical protein Q8R53_04735 [Nanoarchaeota archaeon]|nr:hypothetical protein [Nanoarchaeota archaeon]
MTITESRFQAEELPLYVPKYFLPRTLDWRVQKVSSGLVAKFPRFWEYEQDDGRSRSLQNLVHESHMLSEAYLAGISVPRLEGLFVVSKQQHGFVNQMRRKKIRECAYLTDGLLLFMQE